MKKQRLRAKLIGFQKDLISLSRELETEKELARRREDALYLELAAVLDAFENVFNTLREKEETLDKSARRVLKSFQAINRKLLRILEESGVERLAFPDGKAEIGLCKIVDTEVMEGAEDGTIVSVIRSGYRRGERILRPAEVITVANR
jgi:molecular chaperone GrpE (heat shock protein)